MTDQNNNEKVRKPKTDFDKAMAAGVAADRAKRAEAEGAQPPSESRTFALSAATIDAAEKANIDNSMAKFRKPVGSMADLGRGSTVEEAVNTFLLAVYSCDSHAREESVTLRDLYGSYDSPASRAPARKYIRSPNNRSSASFRTIPIHLQLAYYERAASILLAHRDACMARMIALSEKLNTEVARANSLGLYSADTGCPVATTSIDDFNVLGAVSEVLSSQTDSVRTKDSAPAKAAIRDEPDEEEMEDEDLD